LPLDSRARRGDTDASVAVEHVTHRHGRREVARPGALPRALARARRLVLRALPLPPSSRRTRGGRPAAIDEAAVMRRERERALARVAAAAGEACDDWARGLDVDEAMLRLRAELRSAAEFTD
jgi:hypothetical protein